MRKIASIALACLACATLPACNPPASAGQVTAKADAALTRAERDYALAKAWADLFVPLLPADKVAVIRRAEVIAEKALATARAAVTIAQQTEALRQAAAATSTINAETSAPTPAA